MKHALETSFLRSGMGQVYIPFSVLGVPFLSAGCVGAEASQGAGPPSAQQPGSAAAQPGPALCDAWHLPEPYLTAQHWQVPPAGTHSWISFGSFLRFGPCFSVVSEEEILSQGQHQSDALYLQQTSTSCLMGQPGWWRAW